MVNKFSNIGTDNHALRSAEILACWIDKAGVERETILTEINIMNSLTGKISDKSFRQWCTTGNLSRLISGYNAQIRGERVVTLIEWFLKEQTHRLRSIMTTDELREMMRIYSDIPVKNRLQLKSLIHDLEIRNHERSSDFSFANNWRVHFSEWPAFCFVIDPYWCIRATTSYEMALAGYGEEDMHNWGWWHRLLASQGGEPKYKTESKRFSLRGPYADTY